MLSALLERFFKGVDDTASAPVIKEHLEMLKTAAELLEKENNELKAQNSILNDKVKQIEELESKLESFNQFVDLGIVKIKLGKDGNRLPTLYCPECNSIVLMPEDYSEPTKHNIEILGMVACSKKCGYKMSIAKIRQAVSDWESKLSG